MAVVVPDRVGFSRLLLESQIRANLAKRLLTLPLDSFFFLLSLL